MGERPNVFIANTATTGFCAPLPSYQTVDLRAGVVHGDWTLQVYLRNATDERGVTTTVANTGNPKALDAAIGIIQPRTVGVSLAAKF